MINSVLLKDSKLFKILSLDGGGSKGMYSLGVLSEIEAKLKSPLVDHFDCFYGCSTGAIIAAALASGKRVQDIKEMYVNGIPEIMRTFRTKKRSQLLREMLINEFGDKKFDTFNKFVCVVATSKDEKIPKLFKSHPEGAHARKNSFQPGFDFTIAEALVSSCAAEPFFKSAKLRLGNTFIDGGFCLTNPTLFAIIDSLKAFQKKKEEIVIINVGTGEFPHKISLPWAYSSMRHILSKELIENILESHSNTAALVTKLLFEDVNVLRINNTYVDIKTNIVESDPDTLEQLFSRGQAAFGKIEKEFENIFRGP